MSVGTLPGKLADCQSKTPPSPNSTWWKGLRGRFGQTGSRPLLPGDSPLKGKILNVEKSRIDKILKSDEIKNMITAWAAASAKISTPKNSATTKSSS